MSAHEKLRRERLEALTLMEIDGELEADQAQELDALLEDEALASLHGLLLEQEAALRGGRAHVDVVTGTMDAIARSRRVEAGVRRAIAPQRGWWQSSYARMAQAALLVLALGFGGALTWVSSWQAPPEEALVFALRALEPGAPAHIQALVRNARTLAPYAHTAVRFVLEDDAGQTVWEASRTTDGVGVATVDDVLPATLPEGSYTLRVLADGREHQPSVARAVTVQRAYRIYVTSDKPRYQPGQFVRMRALAMNSEQLPAGGRDLVFRVHDAKGNLVFESPQKTSPYGLAAVDFELAEQVNTGRYAVSAAIGKVSSERAVLVESYVLPKMKLAVNTEKPFYAPGDTIHGTAKATYTFGEPVEHGTVEVVLRDAASDMEMASAKAEKGTEGVWRFAIPIAPRFGELDPDGDRSVVVEARVVDAAGFANVARVERVVTPVGLLADVTVAGGRPVLGVDNHVYLTFRTPDGQPAPAQGTFAGAAFSSDERGIAEVVVELPAGPTAELVATANGQQLRRNVPLVAAQGVVVHSDRSVYAGGATMQVVVLASAPRGTVFVDAVQVGRTLWTKAVELDGGRAELSFDVPADVHGPVRLRAFMPGAERKVERSDRVVLVEGQSDLALTTTLDRESYRPGDVAKLHVAVRQGGERRVAAVSIAGVDEAVFALGDARPGLEPTFSELDATGKSPLSLAEALRLSGEARERAAGMLFAKLATPADDQLDPIGQDGYAGREANMARERQRWRNSILGALCISPLALGVLLLLVVVGRLLRLAWSGAALPDEEIARALRSSMRWFVLGWIFGLALPVAAALFGAALAREEGGLLGLVIGMASAEFWLRRTRQRVRSIEQAPSLARSLALAEAGYVLTSVGVLGLILVESQRWLSHEADGWLVALAVLFPLVGGALSAAVARLTEDATKARRGWLFASRTVLTATPVLLLVPTLFLTRYEAADAVVAATAPVATAPRTTMVPPLQKPQEGETAAASRVRSDFPETLLWQPELLTDERGELELEVPLADSVTTWRLSLSAVSLGGGLGAREQGVRVFQPFFIEPDLPGALTQNDEVALGIGVFNYLDGAQKVTVALADADWMSVGGPRSQTVELEAREVRRVSFRVKVLRAGEHRLRVDASAGEIADAVVRVVTVVPDGERVDAAASGVLTSKAELSVDIPPEAIAGSEDLVLKIYPASFSEVAEGMESVFRMPSGCFEQTSSVTYPSLLVLDYLRAKERLSPELQATAQRFVQLGYQRLLTYEVPGGGFEWFGKAPANPVLTAYGLMEFHDMQRVQAVDEAMVARTQAWLLAQQQPDGTFTMENAGIQEGATVGFEGRQLRTSAYITWSLAETGVDDPRVARALDALAAHVEESNDNYTRALLANALVAGHHPSAPRAVAELARAVSTDGGMSWWTSEAEGVTYGRGAALEVETTALAAYALMHSGTDVDVAQRALGWLSSKRDPAGTWASTQATVAAMRALLRGTSASTVKSNVGVLVQVEGETVETIDITPKSSDVMRVVSLRAAVRKGARRVSLVLKGEASLSYQLVTTFYRPWSTAAGARDISLSVDYSRTDMRVGDEVFAILTVRNNRATVADMTLVDFGVVPGLALDVASLDRLVMAKIIERYDREGTRVRLYLRKVAPNGATKLAVRHVAERPAVVRTPSVNAYHYYEPKVRDRTMAVTMTIRD